MAVSESLLAFRYGFGLPLAAKAPRSPEEMLARLSGPDEMALRWPAARLDEIAPLLQGIKAKAKEARKNPAAQAEIDAMGQSLAAIGQRAMKASMARMVVCEDGFRERLVAFWTDHFTVSAGGNPLEPMVYALVDDAIRPHVAKPFVDMLTAVTFHPAMLGYLDQNRSVGPNSKVGRKSGAGLNENLARELLELHTLGVDGAYGQDDVRQMAELLTGLRFDAVKGTGFDPRIVEEGPETVLGRDYDGEGDAPIRAALADLARHPDTARHIARKLAVHFLGPDPDPRLVEATEAAWRDTGGDLQAVYRAFLGHPAAWVDSAEKVRQPQEYLAAALRALGVSAGEIADWPFKTYRDLILRPLKAMGQPWKAPRGPDGWPEDAEAWITPQALAERIAWAMARPSRLVKPLPDPVEFARTALGDRAPAAVIWAAQRAENRAEGLGIVLASPAFNRR